MHRSLAPAFKRMAEFKILDGFDHMPGQKFRAEYLTGPKAIGNIGKRVKGRKTFDLDTRLRILEPYGEDYGVIATPPAPQIEMFGPPSETPDIARFCNDDAAALVESHGYRFPAFVAALAMNNPEAASAEALRAVRELGAVGVLFYTNVCDRPLTHCGLDEFFAEMDRQNIACWMHPIRGENTPDYVGMPKSLFEAWWVTGWPHETANAMYYLIMSGLFKKHPGLRILTHHGGGTVTAMTGRFGHGTNALGQRTSDEEESAAYRLIMETLGETPEEALRHFFADTATFGNRLVLSSALEFFPRDHIVYATDAAFSQPEPQTYIDETLAALQGIKLDEGHRRLISKENLLMFIAGK